MVRCNSDITKHSKSLQNWWKDEKKTGQGGCQEAYSNIKGAAGISVKYWLCSRYDNNLPYSSNVWAMGKGGKKNIKAWLDFAETHYKSPKSIWENVL